MDSYIPFIFLYFLFGKLLDINTLALVPGLEVGGEMNLAAGIQIAQLALKHRQNKKQQQRIIVFAGRLIFFICIYFFV